jgi:DNA-binding GntR family transcriptional regulator
MRAPAPRFQTKAEWVYAGLREMIATGELVSGERLPMAQLAERFQTSEMPVREALRMLQRDGLVQPLFRMDPDRARLAQREHRAMLDAVSRHDPVAADAAARAHRDATLEAWRSVAERLRGRSS